MGFITLDTGEVIHASALWNEEVQPETYIVSTNDPPPLKRSEKRKLKLNRRKESIKKRLKK